MQIDLLQPHGERIIFYFYITEVKWKVHANHKKCCNFTSAAAAAAIYNCDCGHALMKFDSSIKKNWVEYDSVLYAQMSYEESALSIWINFSFNIIIKVRRLHKEKFQNIKMVSSVGDFNDRTR